MQALEGNYPCVDGSDGISERFRNYGIYGFPEVPCWSVLEVLDSRAMHVCYQNSGSGLKHGENYNLIVPPLETRIETQNPKHQTTSST